jgi:hypothetical protein
MFAGGGCLQILDGAADNTGGECRRNLNFAALEEFEFPLGVLLFLIGRSSKIAEICIYFFSWLAGKYVLFLVIHPRKRLTIFQFDLLIP